MKKKKKGETPKPMPVRFYKSERSILATWSKREDVSEAEVVRRAVVFYNKNALVK